jgi:glycosyltransferase involved in cell wall biosynthesis
LTGNSALRLGADPDRDASAAGGLKLSIVTVCYNQGNFLDACLRSVHEQAVPFPLEHIVVEAGSTDGVTQAVIGRRADWISKVIWGKDQGPGDGLNKGFAAATGTHFMYLNADDILLPNALLAVGEAVAAQQDVDVWIGNGLILNEQGVACRPVYSDRWSDVGYAYGAVTALQQATFFTADAFRATAGFNLQNRTCWDGELLVDLSLQGARFAHVESFIGGFRVYPASITGSGRLRDRYREDQRRIFIKLRGRPRHPGDDVFALLARCAKRARAASLTLTGRRR